MNLMNLDKKKRVEFNTGITSDSTPKRRLSFTAGNTPLGEHSQNILNSPNEWSNDENCRNNKSPLIKRKCISRTNSLWSRYNSENSPCAYANIIKTIQNSPPVNLNDSLEVVQIGRREDEMPVKKDSIAMRRLHHGHFSKHLSAPLMNGIECDGSTSSFGTCQPLNDISNRFRTKLSNLHRTNVDFAARDSLSADSAVNDLENLIFGNEADQQSTTTSINYEKSLKIKQSLEIDAACNNLIGDRSKQHILPVIPSAKHTDLHCISPETLVNVLNGNFNEQIDEYIIIDSRYPYEYEGGHISQAKNIFTKEKLYEEMFLKRLNLANTKLHHMPSSVSSNCLTSTMTSASSNESSALGHSVSNFNISKMAERVQEIQAENDLYSAPIQTNNHTTGTNKRVIIIFHCEFSSERGPSLLRFLRNQDRALNEDSYPNLYYPELYLLEGGYKNFYENFKTYCYPQMYKPMLHAEHVHDLKHFRSKAKSWEVSKYQYLLNKSSGDNFLKKKFKSNIKQP